jgi:hypothetical protein
MFGRESPSWAPVQGAEVMHLLGATLAVTLFDSLVPFKPRLSRKCYPERLQQQNRIERQDDGGCYRGQYGSARAVLANAHDVLSTTEP